MLPRKKYLRVLCFSLAATFTASTLISAPAQSITGYTPPVTVNEISVTPIPGMTSMSTGKRTTILLPAQTVSPFTLAGLTWVGPVLIGTDFKVRVRESGVWSAWFKLEYGEYQGVGKDGTESFDTRVGSDPLLTGLADGVEVIMENTSGVVPSQMKVTLVNSQVTKQDRNLGQQSIRMATTDTGMQSQAVAALVGAAVSPQGALVARPRIVTRAEWGADETWRDPVPRVGTTLLAGIVHHTASTNNYTADQAPAQMRNLYAYFTKSLNYADMGYNFLVDKYGTIYEGRSGCAVGAVDCDSASVPVRGAHTAGLNINTFGVSAIGNYDVLAPENPGAMVESIASLMAWKLAPYGLDPNATASIMSTDTSGSSKFSKGQTAITQVISAHRDVGKTVCPGRYLYPYMAEIRARATELLAPVINSVSVTPNLIDIAVPTPVSVSAVIPATGNWTVTVTNPVTGELLKSSAGTQTTTSAMAYTWDRTNAAGAPVAAGRYLVSIAATVGTAVLTPTTSEVVIANKPSAVTAITYKKVSRTKARISWTNPAEVLPISTQYVRVSTNGGKTYGKWIKTSKASASATFKNWKKGHKYTLQVKVTNSLGESAVSTKRFTMR